MLTPMYTTRATTAEKAAAWDAVMASHDDLEDAVQEAWETLRFVVIARETKHERHTTD